MIFEVTLALLFGHFLTLFQNNFPVSVWGVFFCTLAKKVPKMMPNGEQNGAKMRRNLKTENCVWTAQA